MTFQVVDNEDTLNPKENIDQQPSKTYNGTWAGVANVVGTIEPLRETSTCATTAQHWPTKPISTTAVKDRCRHHPGHQQQLASHQELSFTTEVWPYIGAEISSTRRRLADSVASTPTAGLSKRDHGLHAAALGLPFAAGDRF